MGRPHSMVIGGTHGSGRALVRAWTKAKHVVSVIGRSPISKKQQGFSRVHYWSFDLTDAKRVVAMLSEITSVNGKLSHVAFFQRYRGKGDPWVGELETSLTATRKLIESLVGVFDAKSGGAIVLVNSIAGHFVVDEQPVGYHVVKAGLNQMARYYAAILGPRGIRVNCVSPSTILKDESGEFYLRNERLMKLYREIAPLRRMVTADDVAQVISFLCSPAASAITGQNIVVDAGISLWGQESLCRRITGLSHPGSMLQNGTLRVQS